MSKFWRTIENIHRAVPARWQAALGQDYDAVKLSFLRATGKKVGEYPCPHECGCWHEVIEHDEDDIVGVCRCDPEESNCDNLCLTAEEIEQFDLNTAKLGRAVARAFGCEPNESSFDLEQTWQIGAFGGAALPVILTMQSSAGQFRNVVANLVAKLQKPFILLAPTNRYLEINSQSLLIAWQERDFLIWGQIWTWHPTEFCTRGKVGGNCFRHCCRRSKRRCMRAKW